MPAPRHNSLVPAPPFDSTVAFYKLARNWQILFGVAIIALAVTVVVLAVAVLF
jgi:hypothetical protein